MPTTKSAAKRLRQSQSKRLVNRATKSALKTQIGKIQDAVKAGDAAKATEVYAATVSKLDKAGAKRVIHPNKASRLKSRLSKAIKAAKSK